MSYDAWITLCVILAAFLGLAMTGISADLIMMAALTALLVMGVLTPTEALVGFSNEGMATVAVLYVVANGLYETGVVNQLATRFLGQPKSPAAARLRLMPPVALFSAMLNNTPVVAMMIPTVTAWAKRYQIQPSQLMIPLSFAAIIGGTCTLIGTSTTLILNSMYRNHAQVEGLSMFELAWVGVPCSLAVIVSMVLLGRYLLPSREDSKRPFESLRRYTVEMMIQPQSPLDGVSIESAGLRNLPHLYLVSVERDGEVKAAVSPHEVLRGNDRLMFVGVVESIIDLKNMRGLVLVDDEDRFFQEQNLSRSLVEVVVSPHCPLISKSIKESRFRTHYNAAIVAVARHGMHLHQKIGQIRLAVGDTLLLDAPENFLDQQRYSKDFLLVSSVENSQSTRHAHRFRALTILLGMILLVGFQWLPMLHAAMLAAGMMLLGGCTTGAIARKSIDWSVLIVIGASIGLGMAVEKTGLDSFMAQLLFLDHAESLRWVLFKLYLLTAVATSLLSNTTAAVLLFPVAMASSQTLGADPMPFLITLVIGASASFATPIGYQTNLMVFGPGGYRFADYLRAGLPMILMTGLIAIAMIPWIWPA